MWYTEGKIEEWFNIWIENPFKTWWKARKYFKRPKIHFTFHLVHIYGPYPYATYYRLGKILDISANDVMWKDKYDTPRHERSPYIFICLFRKFGLSITTRIDYYNEFGEVERGDMYYWEYLLNYLYYNKDLLSFSQWMGTSRIYNMRVYGNAEDGSEDVIEPFRYVVPVVPMSLNKEGIKQLKEELNGRRNNTK